MRARANPARDVNLREHTWLQAIARVNRTDEGKSYGLIVDYWRVEAIIDSRGRTITTSAGNVARMGWNPRALLAAAIAARAVGLPRKGAIVSIQSTHHCALAQQAADGTEPDTRQVRQISTGPDCR